MDSSPIDADRTRFEQLRNKVRGKLVAAGILGKVDIFEDLEPVNDEEIERLGQMRPGARLSEDLISETRGLLR
jgi:hypothetical protein